MKSFILGLLLSTVALATSNDLVHRPKSFNTTKGKAVFVDFTEATYNITYDIANKRAWITSIIQLNVVEEGLPVFDSVTAPTKITINGVSTSALEVNTPSNETTLRILDKSLSVGKHELKIEQPLATLVEFQDGSVKSAFWTSDLSSRQFLERYMPANLEFDQVKMTFLVSFLGGKTKQTIYTNGEVVALDASTYKITYPPYFNASSIFFHTVPEGSVDETRFTIKSIDGREVPVVIYAGKSIFDGSANLLKFKNETIRVFHELEGDYGAWPHQSVIIYNAGLGGMEYCGATITEYRALGHELFHSYFARGVMPANGNSGWLDEALASWRDNGYKTETSMTGSSQMSSHPYYTRITDRAAYSFGERFMRYLDGKLKGKGGLKPFMRYMVDQKVFSPLFVEEFIKEMTSFYGTNVEEDFRRFTFGTSAVVDDTLKSRSHPIHRKMSLEDLKSIL